MFPKINNIFSEIDKTVRFDDTGNKACAVTGTVDAFIQDQVTPPFQYFITKEDKNDITLTSPIAKGDSIISVSAGHGFTAAGEYIIIQEGDIYTQQEVISVNTNDITISSPVPVPFSTNAIVIRGSIDLNINGSVVEQEFVLWKRAGIPVDIQRIHITIWNASVAGDDGTFGDLAALTNGLLVRKENTVDQALGNYKTNSDFRDLGGTVDYNAKAPAGTNGVAICFDVKQTYGVVLRIDPDIPDKIVITVRDDLSTLNRLRISLMGQYTSGE